MRSYRIRDIVSFEVVSRYRCVWWEYFGRGAPFVAWLAGEIKRTPIPWAVIAHSYQYIAVFNLLPAQASLESARYFPRQLLPSEGA